MDIGALSMIMSQSKVQQSPTIAVMKMAMNTGKEAAAQMTEMMKNVVVDPNLGQHLDAKARYEWKRKTEHEKILEWASMAGIVASDAHFAVEVIPILQG